MMQNNKIDAIPLFDSLFIEIRCLKDVLLCSQDKIDMLLDCLDFLNSLKIKSKTYIEYNWIKTADPNFKYSKTFIIDRLNQDKKFIELKGLLELRLDELKFIHKNNSLLRIGLFAEKNDFKFDSAHLNTFELFQFINDLKDTVLIKFLIFYYYQRINKELDFCFISNNFGSFENKLYKFQSVGEEAFFHGNLKNKNSQIIIEDEYINEIITLYKDGARFSVREITKKINTLRILDNKKTISRNKVIEILCNNKTTSLLALDLIRNGKEESFNNLILHAQREQPNYPGQIYQMDGTRLNFLLYNEKNDIAFYNLIIVMDVYSKFIIGYKINKTETFADYEFLINQSVEYAGFLPNEIVLDNLSSFKTDYAIRYFSQLKNYNVNIRKHLKNNPQDKSQIENWFNLFGNKYLKGVKGYLGDGIKSKYKDGKPNKELLKEYRNPKNIQSIEVINSIIEEKIRDYNNNYNYKNSSPINLFHNTISKCNIVDENIKILITYRTKEFFLNKAFIRIEVGKKIYEYPFTNDESVFFKSYYKRNVVVKFNPKNMDSIYIYPSLNYAKLQFVKLNLHNPIPMSSLNMTDKQISAKNKFYRQKKEFIGFLNNEINTFLESDISKEIDKKIGFGKNNKLKYNNPIPIDVVDHEINTKEEITESNLAYQNNLENNIDFKSTLRNLYKITGNNKIIN